MKVLLAHRDPGLKARLRRLMKRIPDVRLVGETSTGRSAIRRARLARPAVAILGSDLRGPRCLETVQSIKTIRPRTQFIVLTVRHTKAQVRAARRSGANYCLPERTLASVSRPCWSWPTGTTWPPSEGALPDPAVGERIRERAAADGHAASAIVPSRATRKPNTAREIFPCRARG